MLTRTLPIRGPICHIRLKISARSILGSILHALSQADSVPCCAPSQHQRRLAEVRRSLATGYKDLTSDHQKRAAWRPGFCAPFLSTYWKPFADYPNFCFLCGNSSRNHLPSSICRPPSSISHPLDSSLSFLSFLTLFRASCPLSFLSLGRPPPSRVWWTRETN